MSLIQLPTFKMRPDEQIVPLQFNHLLNLELGPHEKEYARNIPGYLDYVYENSEQGWSWAAIGRGKVICVFGVRDIWPGVVEAWFLPGEGLENHARSTLTGARSLLGDNWSIRYQKDANFCKITTYGSIKVCQSTIF